MKAKTFFYARPCDEPRRGYCVEEVEIKGKDAKWSSTLFEPAMVKAKDWAKLGMTKRQANLEAQLTDLQRNGKRRFE